MGINSRGSYKDLEGDDLCGLPAHLRRRSNGGRGHSILPQPQPSHPAPLVEKVHAMVGSTFTNGGETWPNEVACLSHDLWSRARERAQAYLHWKLEAFNGRRAWA